MIQAAYPLLYGRDVSGAELEAGLAFLAERRASASEADIETGTADGGPEEEDPSLGDGSPSPENDPDDLEERRASMQAWTQYARALFSAAEFRFID